jgi:hypothetical protein
MSSQVDPTITQQTAPAAAAPAVDWKSSLSEDLRGEKSLSDFKDVSAMAKSYVETKKMMGDAVRLPKTDAPPEDWDKFYARLGRPEAPDKYEFKRPQLAEGAKYDEEMETAFKGLAHKAGLHPRQAQSLLEGYNAMQAERLQKYTGQMEEGVNSLKKEWGQNYDKNLSVATRAVKELGGDELIAMLDETGLGNHPTLIKLFSRLGQDMTEDTFVVGDTASGAGAKTPADIEAELAAIRTGKDSHYMDKFDNPLKQAAMRQVEQLTEQLLAMRGMANANQGS